MRSGYGFRILGVVVVAVALASCSGDGSPSPSPSSAVAEQSGAATPGPYGDGSAVPTPGPDDEASPPPGASGIASPSAVVDGGTPPAPGAEPRIAAGMGASEVAAHLVRAADLGDDWGLWRGFEDWPGGVPGPIPEEQRDSIGHLPMCPAAGDEAVALAADIPWEAFTQLHRETADPFLNMVTVQQFLLAEDPGTVQETFETLREGMTACLTENLPEGEWEIGLREPIELSTFGEDRYGEQSRRTDTEGSRIHTTWVLVRDGAALLAARFDDILIRADSEPVLTVAEVHAVVVAIVERLG